MNLTAHNFYEMEKDICKSARYLIDKGTIEITNPSDFITIIVPKVAKEFTEEFAPKDIAENYPGLIDDFTKDKLISYYKKSELP